jgi:membrane-bound metal-dependent hydrolase YbcI (DUF457 family)
MLLGFEYLRSQGMLMTDVAPWMQLAIMYPAASWGSTAPDLDHHLNSVKEQTPFNLVVHKILHTVTKPKHRAWQTHSILPTCLLPLALIAVMLLVDVSALGVFETTIIQLVLVGATAGFLSHIILDALTTAGVYLLPKVKLRLVPKKSFFATGTKWESFIRGTTYLGCVAVIIYWIYLYAVENNFFGLGGIIG